VRKDVLAPMQFQPKRIAEPLRSMAPDLFKV